MKQPFVKPTAAQITRWIESNATNHSLRHSQTRGDIYLIDNPGIIGDSGLHIGISPDQGWVKDYRPHMSRYCGSFLRFVSTIRNCSIQDAIKEVCGGDANLKGLLAEARKRMRRQEPEPEETEVVIDDDIKLPPGLLSITDKSTPKAWEFATGYLKKRAVSLEEAARLKVMYNGTMLCFPYIEYGELVYWQARTLMGKQYIFPDATATRSAEDFLHGFDFIEPQTQIILVESIFNEIVCGEGTMATGGATLKHKQYRRIRNVLEPSKTILAPDNDDAGIASLKHNYNLLRQSSKDIYYCLPPNRGEDWNDMAQREDRLNHMSVVRDYIETHNKPLNISTLMKLTIKL